ncbi:TonB-dependent receptor [Pendulispora rubella]|uniref:TonB-dependent receptor n=1 Tax=Pendulispora rubella TaxID=2741070 RepID=A0ABZ2L574_9BACT
MILRWGPWAISAVTLAISVPARAQQGDSMIAGKITNGESRAAVRDAIVSITSPELQDAPVVVTDATGTYRVPSLPPGIYDITVQAEPFRDYRREHIQVHAHTTVRLDIALLPESFYNPEVVIPSRTPIIDTASTMSSTNVDSEFLSRVPITSPGAHGGAQRTFESAAEAAPGAGADLYGTSISGTSSPENAYIVDGLRTNNPRYGTNGSPLSIEFVKEVSVLSGGYMPEYGRATGGILDVVTKSGSNQYHGSVWANWTPGALEGSRRNPYFVNTAIQTRRSLGNIYDIGFDQSGPLVRDKLWYYAGFDVARAMYDLNRTIYRVDGTEVDGSSRTYRASFTSYQVFAKLDYRLDANDKVALTFAATPTTSGGEGDYSVSPRTGLVESAPREFNLTGAYGALAHTRRSGAYDTVFKWTSHSQNKSRILETTLGWHHEVGGSLGADGFGVGSGLGLAALPAITYGRITNMRGINDFERVPGCETAALCPVPQYRSGGPGFIEQHLYDTYALKSVLTLLGQAAGHHVIKAGAELEWATSWASRGWSGGGNLGEHYTGKRFNGTSTGYLRGPDQAVVLDRYVTRSNGISAGAFLQDSWAIADRVTLNAGVRYDSQFLFGSDGKIALALPHQLSPRVGLVFAPFHDGRSKLFASYARYTESVPLNLADRGTESSTTTSVRTDGSRFIFPAAGGRLGYGIPDRAYTPVGGGKILVDPDLRAPSSSEISAGFEFELFANARIGASYLRRWMNQAVEDMSNDEGMTYFIGNPGRGIAKDFPEARRDYDAGTLYFTKLFAQGWLARVSYTLSWLRGNMSGLYRTDTGTLEPHTSVDFDLKSLLVNQTGDLPGDHRHSIKVYGARDWVLTRSGTLQLGASLQARSGGPTNYLGGHIIYGPDSVFILPGGSGERLPWSSSLGTHTAYVWHFDNGISLSFTVDVFNLLDLHAILARDEQYVQTDVLPIPRGTVADLPGKLQRSTGEPFSPSQLNPNFGNATYYQEPRQIRFGLRGSF